MTDSFRVRDLHPIPLFSEQACVSKQLCLRSLCLACFCPGRACATKAIYLYNFLYQCAVVSYKSSFAKLAFFGKRCIRSFRCFLRKQGQLHLQSVSAIQLSPYGSASSQSFPFRLKPGKRCRRSVHKFAVRIGTRTIRKPLHLTYQRFCCLALLRQNRVRSIKKLPLLGYKPNKRSLGF